MASTRLLFGSLAGLLLSVLLFALVVGYAALVFVVALLTGAPLVGTLLDLAVPWLLVAGLLVVTGVGSLVGLLYGLARRATRFESERAAALAERTERGVPGLEGLGLSGALAPPEPTAEERADRALAGLKEQYVAGEIDEGEFERRVDRLVASDEVDAARAAREHRVVVEDAEVETGDVEPAVYDEKQE